MKTTINKSADAAKHFTPAFVKSIVGDLIGGLNTAGKKHGIHVSAHGGSIGRTHFDLKVRLLMVGGEQADAEASGIRLLGLDPAIIGRTVTSKKYGAVKIAGVDLRRPKFPVNVVSVDGSRSIKVTVDGIRAMIEAADAEAAADKPAKGKRRNPIEELGEADANANNDDLLDAISNMDPAELDDDDIAAGSRKRSRRVAKAKPVAGKKVSAKGKAFAEKMKAARAAKAAEREAEEAPKSRRRLKKAKPARNASKRTSTVKLTCAELKAKQERAEKRAARKARKLAAEKRATRSTKRNAKPASRGTRRTTRTARQPAARARSKRTSRMA